jgi:hypothetical protein
MPDLRLSRQILKTDFDRRALVSKPFSDVLIHPLIHRKEQHSWCEHSNINQYSFSRYN